MHESSCFVLLSRRILSSGLFCCAQTSVEMCPRLPLSVVTSHYLSKTKCNGGESQLSCCDQAEMDCESDGRRQRCWRREVRSHCGIRCLWHNMETRNCVCCEEFAHKCRSSVFQESLFCDLSLDLTYSMQSLNLSLQGRNDTKSKPVFFCSRVSCCVMTPTNDIKGSRVVSF